MPESPEPPCTACAIAWPPSSSGRGELLQAQQRLGHRDPSTTLRNYAHAMPLEDESVADDIDQMLGTSGPA
jgi:hypothetical protein